MPLPPTTNAASFGWKMPMCRGVAQSAALAPGHIPPWDACRSYCSCCLHSYTCAVNVLGLGLIETTRTAARVSLTWYGVDALAPIDSGRRGALHKALPSLHRAGTAASPPSSRGAARRRWGPPAARCSNTSRRRNQDSLVIHRSHALRVQVRLRGRKRRRRQRRREKFWRAHHGPRL